MKRHTIENEPEYTVKDILRDLLLDSSITVFIISLCVLCVKYLGVL